MIRTGRWLRAAGEGALAGWAVGFALGYWPVLLNEDLSRRMFHLACERFFPPLLAGAILGALVSFGVELLFAGAERVKRGALLCMVILAILYAGGVALAAFPFRPRLFPLRIFSGKLASLFFFAMMAGPPGALLAVRFRESLGRARRADAGAPGPARRPAFAAPLGLSLTVLAAAAAMLAPRLSPSRPGNGLSVILLSLDTLRADRVGALGCPRPLTPRLDSLARQGTVFEQAESSAPWTLPSHASIFSSLLPFDHGARWEHKPLRPAIATLAEHFREAGFRTASFNGGGYISAYLGLSQGFEIYEEHDEGKEGGPERIAASALAWIRSHRSDPFFLFLHTYEAHSPYTHPELADPDDAGGLSRTFEVADVVAVQRGERFLTPRERRYVAALYDGDVAHADRVMGGLLETLRGEGILDHVLLVVLSDHGEDLWDHDMRRSPGHGHSLYEEILHVPLFFRAPGKVAAGARIGAPVSLIDVAPTILALAGLPSDPGHRGRSLESALRGGAEPSLAPIAAESTEYGPDRFSLRHGSLKVILAPRPEQANAGISIPGVRPLEIFDLQADPDEKNDLSSAAPAGAAASVESLWKRAEKVLKPAADDKGSHKLPAELEEQLRSLGYVQ